MTTKPTTEATPVVTQSSLAGKYLTFTLQSESFGIDVLKVREIIRNHAITVVPQMPAHILGVINLRGKIIPVMDLRLRFGFPQQADTGQTCVVVVQVKAAAGKAMCMGLLVDSVEEVIYLGANEIEETPEFGGQVETEYILGMAKIKGIVKALLDIDKIIIGPGAKPLEGDPALGF